MTPIKINNVIHLVEDDTMIEVSINIWRVHIEQVLFFTKAKILEKTPVTPILDLGINSNEMYKLKIKVKFGKIKHYLDKCAVGNAINKGSFMDLIRLADYKSVLTQMFENKVSLASSFGKYEPKLDLYSKPTYVSFYNKKGGEIKLYNVHPFDKVYRYINFHGTWLSNKKY